MFRRHGVLLTLLGVLLAAGLSAPADLAGQLVDVYPAWTDESGDLPGISSGTSMVIAAGAVVAAIVLWKVLKSDGDEEASGNDSGQASSLLHPTGVATPGQVVPAWDQPAGTRARVPVDRLVGIGSTTLGGHPSRVSVGLSLHR